LARRLAARGHPVALAARRIDLLESLAEEIQAEGGSAVALACDVTHPAQVAAAVRQAEAALGPVERLICCAGGGEKTRIEGFSADHVERVIAVNVGGTANCIEAVLPGMVTRGRGQIVAVGSLAACRGLPGAAAYCAAKAALAALMEGLRVDLAPRGIIVTLLMPGFVQTNPEKKRKPLALSLDVATARMVRTIEAGKLYDAFPWRLRLPLVMLRLAPTISCFASAANPASASRDRPEHLLTPDGEFSERYRKRSRRARPAERVRPHRQPQGLRHVIDGRPLEGGAAGDGPFIAESLCLFPRASCDQGRLRPTKVRGLGTGRWPEHLRAA
jgi:short-subunit dehydrogenase